MYIYDGSQVRELHQEAGAVQEEGRARWCGVLVAACLVSWTNPIKPPQPTLFPLGRWSFFELVKLYLKLHVLTITIMPHRYASNTSKRVRCKRTIAAPLNLHSSHLEVKTSSVISIAQLRIYIRLRSCRTDVRARRQSRWGASAKLHRPMSSPGGSISY